MPPSVESVEEAEEPGALRVLPQALLRAARTPRRGRAKRAPPPRTRPRRSTPRRRPGPRPPPSPRPAAGTSSNDAHVDEGVGEEHPREPLPVGVARLPVAGDRLAQRLDRPLVVAGAPEQLGLEQQVVRLLPHLGGHGREPALDRARRRPDQPGAVGRERRERPLEAPGRQPVLDGVRRRARPRRGCRPPSSAAPRARARSAARARRSRRKLRISGW